MMERPFRVGVTDDFCLPDGRLGFGDIGLDGFRDAGLDWEFFRSPTGEISADAAAEFDGLLVLGPRVTAATLAGQRTPKIVARFGVGYDNVDVDACTRHGVVLTITPEGVRRPVAVGALTFLLALTHRLLIKDRLTRVGRWAEKLAHHGQGVTGRVLGIIGFGNIGQELARIVEPLKMHVISYDPQLQEDRAREYNVAAVGLTELLRNADYVVICCSLTPATHHLIGPAELALMKPSSFLINVARGPIVDQAALTAALQQDRIAGAGLDVFEHEPIDPEDPLLKFENVIVAPHAICWTDECFGLNGRSAVGSLVDVANGRIPKHIVNRPALAHARWQDT
jgi:D-3-phosphoglycerate dehydrogenase